MTRRPLHPTPRHSRRNQGRPSPAPSRLLLLVLLLLAGTADGRAQGGAPAGTAAGSPRFERAARPGAPGPNRLELDTPILIRADRLRYGADGAFLGGLDDLRITEPSGREVPYRLVLPAGPRQWRSGTVTPSAGAAGESGIELDLGVPALVDRLRVSGVPAPFARRFRLEGSTDRSRWATLTSEGTLFDLPAEGLHRTEAEFRPGEYRYLRLTWDRASGAVPAPGGVEARLARRDDPEPALRQALQLERRESEPGESRFRVRLPGAGLPIVALEISAGGGGALRREATVTEGRLAGGAVVPFVLGKATLRRAMLGPVAAADLRIPIATPQGAELELAIDDAGGPPLEVIGVATELAPLPWLYFEAASAEPLVARFGDPEAKAPGYSLAPGAATPATARWGDVRALNPGDTAAAAAGPPPAPGGALDPAAFRHSREIPGESGVTSLALDAGVLAGSRGLADLRIVDAQNREIPYLREDRDEPLAVVLPAPERVEGKDPAATSRYRLALPAAALPAGRLVLTTSARNFEHRVRLVRPGSAGGRETTLATATWKQAGAAPAALVLDLPSGAGEALELVIERDEGPLPLDPPRLLLPGHRLRFFHPEGATLRLLYGNPALQPPAYDPESLARPLLAAAAREVAFEPPAGPEGTVGKPAEGASGKTLLWVAVAAILAVVLFFLARRVGKRRRVD